MKLTKEDFKLHQCTPEESYMFIANYNPYEVIDQILENQEKAEIIQECHNLLINELHSLEYKDIPTQIRILKQDNYRLEQENKQLKEIVERLKKRIEFFKNGPEYLHDTPNTWWINELEGRILKGDINEPQ
jgi:predicted nuclease with TOPRIM domain